MVEFEIETIEIGLFVRMSRDYVIPIFSDYVMPIFRRKEVTYLQTRYIHLLKFLNLVIISCLSA